MTRNLKAVGLALAAALTLVALGASSASAVNPRFHSEVAHATLTGEQEVRNTFTVNAGTIHCSTATFQGTSTEATPASLTIAPTYDGCKITTGLEVLEATVDMNGCHYLFTPGGEVHLTCPSAPIRVTAPLCTVTVHPQTVQKVDYTNTGAGATRSVTVTSTATGLAYTQSSFCPNGGGGSFTNGTYSGAVSTTCADTDQNHVGCWWSTE